MIIFPEITNAGILENYAHYPLHWNKDLMDFDQMRSAFSIDFGGTELRHSRDLLANSYCKSRSLLRLNRRFVLN
jgi:hypothetical protein